MPLPLSFTIVAIGLLMRNRVWKKRLITFGLSLILFFSNPFFSNIAIKAWEGSPTPLEQVQPHDVGVVLTGITNRYKQPNDRVYTNRGADRVLHTIQLYKEGLIRKIIISGGSGKLIDNASDEKESDELRKIFLLADVPENVIFIERESRNTTESAVNVSRILSNQFPNQSIILITSAFHIRRATACFIKQSSQVTPFGTDYYGHDKVYNLDDFLIPKSSAIKNWEVIFRESIGILSYWVLGYI